MTLTDEADKSKWRSAPVECQACGYRWAAAYVDGADEDALECPACKQLSGRVPTKAEYAGWTGLMYKGLQP